VPGRKTIPVPLLYGSILLVVVLLTTGNEWISPNYMPNDGMFVSKDDVT
jgi:hypothetical protein